jgi:hypothetical protein
MTEDPARYAAAERLNKAIAAVQGNLDKLISYSVPKTQAGGRGPETPTTNDISNLGDRLLNVDEYIKVLVAWYE